MNIHFRLSLEELSAFLNRRFEGVIFEGDLANASAWARVEKDGPILLDGDQDKVYVRVPLWIRARLTLRERIFGDLMNFAPRLEKTSFRITAHFAVRLFADDHWELKTSTLGSFKWDDPPAVGLGPVKMKITSILRPLIQAEIDEVAEIIDRAIHEEVALKSRLEVAWKELQEPISIVDEPPVWLHIRPNGSEGKRESFSCDHEAIDTGVFLPMALSLRLAPEAQTPVAFPEFRAGEEIEEAFRARVDSKLRFELFADYFTRQTFDLPKGRGNVQATSMKISTRKDNICCELSIRGRLKLMGIPKKLNTRAFLTFRPYLDEEGRLQAADTRISLLSAGLFIKALDRWGKQYLIRQVQGLIQESLHRIDHMAEGALQDAFRGMRISDNLYLSGKLRRFAHSTMRLEADQLTVLSDLEGILVFQIKIASQA